MRINLYLALLFAPFFTAAQTPILTITGSNTVGATLAPECAISYLTTILGASTAARINTPIANEFIIAGDNNQHISFRAHGSSTGFKDLLARKTDIAMASRPIKTAEYNRLVPQGDLRSASAENAIAIDGLAVIVNKHNPITRLTLDQLSNIFTGKIRNWQELGGRNHAINLYARDNNSGTWDTFKSLVLKKIPLANRAERFESNDVLSSRISADIHGIGFTSLASVGTNQTLAIADENTAFLSPSLLNVASEDYLLSRRLYMYVPPLNDNRYAQDFINHCQSETGQDIVQTIGFVSQNIVALRPEPTTQAPAEYQKLAASAKRLSVNFRFTHSSAELDNKAKRDLLRLANYYQHNSSTVDIILVGFSDTKSRASTAKILSKLRALAVKNALREEGIKVVNSLALGADMPVSANGHSSSVAKNGRVEVWVKPRFQKILSAR